MKESTDIHQGSASYIGGVRFPRENKRPTLSFFSQNERRNKGEGDGKPWTEEGNQTGLPIGKVDADDNKADPYFASFSPLPPISCQHEPTRSQPGAFPVDQWGNDSDANTGEAGIEMVEQQQQQPVMDNDTELPQAWPTSEPVATATPQKARETNKKNRRYLLLGFVALFVAGMLSSIAIPVILARDPNVAEHRRIQQTIFNAFGEDFFDNPQKAKALHWILYEDPRYASSEKGDDRVNLIQRFSLVSFYFQTSTQKPWRSCNPPVNGESSLCRIKHLLGKNSEVMGQRWLTAAHECQWVGVTCAGGAGNISRLNIFNNSLSGSIPATEISMLHELTLLRLANHNLTGSLPNQIFGSIPLEKIELVGNLLTGSIPSQAFLVPSLDKILLSQNKLTGLIPTQIGQFNGSWVALDSNVLSGSIPETLYNAKKLQYILLQNNQLTGTLSSAIGQLTQLKDLDLSGNPVHTSLPSEIGLLNKMVGFKIERTRVGSTIPEELYRNTNLQELRLSSCNLSGTISTAIGQLQKLESFHLANNNLHGTIPKQISSTTKLRSLHLQGNADLTGSIPQKFCSQLRRGYDVAADCTPSASTGVPAVSCLTSCCSMCCDVETRICLEQ